MYLQLKKLFTENYKKHFYLFFTITLKCLFWAQNPKYLKLKCGQCCRTRPIPIKIYGLKHSTLPQRNRMVSLRLKEEYRLALRALMFYIKIKLKLVHPLLLNHFDKFKNDDILWHNSSFYCCVENFIDVLLACKPYTLEHLLTLPLPRIKCTLWYAMFIACNILRTVEDKGKFTRSILPNWEHLCFVLLYTSELHRLCIINFVMVILLYEMNMIILIIYIGFVPVVIIRKRLNICYFIVLLWILRTELQTHCSRLSINFIIRN